MGLPPLFRLFSYLMMHTPPTSPGRNPVLPALPPLGGTGPAPPSVPTDNAAVTATRLPSNSQVPVGPVTTPDPDPGFTIVNGPPSSVSFAGIDPAFAEAFIAALNYTQDRLASGPAPPSSTRHILRRPQTYRVPLAWANRRRTSGLLSNANVPTNTSPPAPSPSTPASNVHSMAPKIRLSDLDFFSGTEHDAGLALDRWLQKLDAYALQFPAFDDGDRMSTAIMKLTGPALDWVRVNAPSPSQPNAWLAFTTTLEATFAPLNRSLTARADLASCRQGTTVRDYLLRFNLASAPVTDLHPAEKFQRFMEGLRPKIREHIILNHPDVHDFSAAASLASRFDMLAIYAASTTTTPPPPRPPAPYRPPAARLNAVTSPAPSTSSPYTPLTPELRESIIAAGGCLYCRNIKPPLHTIESCPTRRPRPTFVLGNGRPQ